MRLIRSHAWRVLVRLRSWQLDTTRRRRLAEFCVRAVRLARPQLRAAAQRAARPLRRRSRAPLVRVATRLPSPRPEIEAPAMTDARGVSIVIPLLNQVAVTYQCLNAVIERTPRGRYEIILVDNASTDATPELLARARGVRVIRNETNRGYGAACNQAAAEARGEFLLFLNNDCVPLDGWLDALCEPLARDPTIGAVGPRLLYPDGRLQEAGSIIWRDGRGWNYGRGDDPRRAQYAHARDVDYASAACLLVRRAVFEQIGGFDPRFTPGYYEDADLCFEIRRLGHRVVYQPRASVVHVEGVTAGRDERAGFKRFQELHRGAFVQKHAAALAQQYPPDARLVFRARDRRPGQRILVVDHAVPTPDRDAGSMRAIALLGIFGELGHKVTFIPNDRTLIEPYTERLRGTGVEVLGSIPITEYILRHLREFDLMIFGRAMVALKYLPMVAARRERPPVVFDTVDLHYLREQRQAAAENSPMVAAEAALTRAVELGLVRASDQTWVVSPYEAALIRQAERGARVEVVPNVHTPRDGVPPFAPREHLLFIGGFRHPPNRDAVAHFVTAIFPRIKARIPGVRFLVVGPNAPADVRRLASSDVQILGHVADVEPVFDRARVFVAPLRYGAGLKGKIGHSLAWGLPVVTTTIGAEGMSLVHREHALIADDPEAFAEAVVELYRDPALWTRLSDRGRRLVAAHFGYEPTKSLLGGLLLELTGG